MTFKWMTPDIRRRAQDLVSRMTLEEKAGQMTQYDWGFNPINPDTGLSQHNIITEQISQGLIGSMFNLSGAAEVNELQRLAREKTPHGIPLLIGRDVIHGYRTVFPIPLAQASAWNPELAGQTAAAASREALADGVAWVFAPMIDVTRDPRWGRIAESIGEDPYLASAYAKAWVEGAQMDEGPGFASASCPKHFAAYGLAEAGRDYNTVDLSDRMLREVILPPFREAIESGALSIMASFNEINGIPACANRYLLTTILREEWGFEGIVCGDYGAIQELIVHGIAADEEEACILSIKAGLDMDMHSGIYARYLPKLVREGKVLERLVDEAVMRILAVKLKLGLFEQPFVNPSEYATDASLPEAHLALARQSARESIVLLRNEKETLPLRKETASIAVIGPLADSKKDPLGCWALDGRPNDVVSLLEGIRQTVTPGTTLPYVQGCQVDTDSEDGIAEALEAAAGADVVVLALGEAFDMSGESRCRTDLDLPGGQRKLVESVAKLGKPIVAVLISGRPLAIPWLQDYADAIVQAWHLGVQSGHAIADVLFGDYNPSGRLTATFPRNVGQIPIYYYRKNTGRPPGGVHTSYYIDSTTEPLYSFGYGLSYTTFRYGRVQLSQERISPDDAFGITIEVTNEGSRSGEEVVQCYLRDEAASVTQPLKKLIAFRKIKLCAGETAIVTFAIPNSALAIIDADMNLTVEPGNFTLWVGPNSSEGETVRLTVERSAAAVD
ncbi:beta-glucosidase [Paenibacillus baekrokdamisoli]|uniref:beta-glucosidase n=1 Tax=Paenibacillus baekrokdamisoli TaxID=1712516 RepID=A0A3G9JFE8_9BACL|nr:beta-glucosidase BglX [Paenibacillus baekrokdamisoli]MBB3071605.1 beta-glucosidase [Paenibacillus baekrokdamisoli]BBH21884.1 beta-glucosidase [Paenibacillus baekrokdamisoli]